MPTDTKTLSCPCPRCGLQDEAQVRVTYSVGSPEQGILPGWDPVDVATFCGCALTASQTDALCFRATEYAERHYHPSGAPRAEALE